MTVKYELTRNGILVQRYHTMATAQAAFFKMLFKPFCRRDKIVVKELTTGVVRFSQN